MTEQESHYEQPSREEEGEGRQTTWIIGARKEEEEKTHLRDTDQTCAGFADGLNRGPGLF